MRTGRHGVSVLPADLVFVTKHRHQVFTAARLEQIMRDACADSGTGLTESNGEPSHVRLLVSFPPEMALSRLANSLKGVSSRRMRQESPAPAPALLAGDRLWSGSYFAGSVNGAPVSVLRQYIEQQNWPRLTAAGVRPPSPPA